MYTYCKICVFSHAIIVYFISDKLRQYNDHLLMQQDINEKEKRAALYTDLTQYWATHQRAQDSRDADLQADLKGAVTVTMPEAKLGPASMQIFQVGLRIRSIFTKCSNKSSHELVCPCFMSRGRESEQNS